MADYVTIANLAASKLGEDDRLTAPDENTHLGRSVAAVWTEIRQAVLREHPWNFALKRWSLPSRVLDPAECIEPWTYAYRIPDGMLRLHEIISPCLATEDWQREGRDILSDSEGPLVVRGVRDMPDTWQWDALFVEAFAFRLAFQIADRITGDRERKADAWAGWQQALRKAKSADGRENPPIPASYEQSTWATARFGL